MSGKIMENNSEPEVFFLHLVWTYLLITSSYLTFPFIIVWDEYVFSELQTRKKWQESQTSFFLVFSQKKSSL